MNQCIREDRDCVVCSLSSYGKDCIGQDISLKAIFYFKFMVDGEFGGVVAVPLLGEGDIVQCAKDQEMLDNTKEPIRLKVEQDTSKMFPGVVFEVVSISRQEFIGLSEAIEGPNVIIKEVCDGGQDQDYIED